MPCSMLKSPFLTGSRHLWPRKNHHRLTNSVEWCKPAQQQQQHQKGTSTRGGRILASAQKNWPISSNGGVRGIVGASVKEEEDGGEAKSEPLEAILVLAGGQLPGGGVPVWVERRLDKALQLQQVNGPECRIVCLGNGTPHRRPILSREGFVVHESTSCAEYLLEKGAPVSVLLKEWGSYDTIGNGYFALTQHVIPRRWRRLAVVTSDFHMPRSHAIFEWVFGLQGAGTSIRDEATNGSGSGSGSVGGLATSTTTTGSRSQGFMLQYHSVPDDGMDASILPARRVKELKALESFKVLATGINALSDFHMWFHTQHKCYNVEHQGLFGKEPLDDPALQSY